MQGVRRGSGKWEVGSEMGFLGWWAARTPRALRAVMLPAVQSLRRAGAEGGRVGLVESGAVGEE
jgi:hypothetical protein